MTNQTIGIICASIFGLIIGSLLNVIVLRFDDLKSILKSRSHCPKCKKTLAWYDLVPFLSYILLWGKCRYCKKEISIQYPLVEIGTGLIFGLLFWKFGLSLELFVLMLISSILVVILTYDILHLLIADVLVWICIGVWIVYLLASFFFIHHSLFFILYSLFGGLVLGGFLGFLVLVSREKWMGAGDIKLGFLLGAVVGYPQVLLVGFLSFVLGSLVGIVLIAFKKKDIKDPVPFAPFLIFATFISIFWGNEIVSWYLGLMGL